MPEGSLSPRLVYNPRPTVRMNGAADPRLAELLLAMEMDEREGGMSRLMLRFSNVASLAGGRAELAFEDERLLALGASITVGAGDVASPAEIFRGTITALCAEFPSGDPPELVVHAEDALQSARMARNSRVFDAMSVAGVVRTIASEHSLTPVIDGLTEVTGDWAQWNESDLAFLRRLLARFHADLQVVGSELHVSPLSALRRNEIELQLHSQLTAVTLTADLAHQVSGVSIGGWDEAAGTAIRHTAQGAAIPPGAGRDAAGILDAAFGPRIEHLGQPVARTAREAEALAQAALERRMRGFVRAQGEAEGNPRLRIGTWVRLSGVSARFDNVYLVTRTCHRYDQHHGYRTEFEAESAYLGRAA
jgi:phage protein D